MERIPTPTSISVFCLKLYFWKLWMGETCWGFKFQCKNRIRRFRGPYTRLTETSESVAISIINSYFLRAEFNQRRKVDIEAAVWSLAAWLLWYKGFQVYLTGPHDNGTLWIQVLSKTQEMSKDKAKKLATMRLMSATWGGGGGGAGDGSRTNSTGCITTNFPPREN